MSSGPYSYETGEVRQFHTGDYAVFGGMLCLSAAIGIIYAIKDRRKNTTEEFLMAGRNMHPIPVAMSLLSSFISSVTVIGTPAEFYSYTSMYWYIIVAMFLTAIGAAHIYIPVFYKLGVTSVFTYVEMRFCRYTKLFCSVIYIVFMLLYMAVVLYTPSLALNAVTGISLWGTIAAVSVVCMFYTTLGGLKAVLWADTLQITIVFIGMLVLVIAGTEVQDGLKTVWEKADEMGKIEFDNIDPDPRVRYSLWNTIVGGSLFWLAVYGVNQAQVQRAIAVRNVTRSKVAIWLNVPGIAFVQSLAIFLGIVMASFYSLCDPVKSKLVNKPDELVPLFTMDLIGPYHGLPGLFLAAVFSGGLSTLSSGYNALVAVILEDFIRPSCCKKMSNAQATWLSKVLVVLIGCICLVLAFMVSGMGSMILQLVLSLFGIFGGPLLGVFTLGMLFPWANRWGGLVGVITSTALMLWIGMGTIVTKTSVAVKTSVSVEGCAWLVSNLTTTTSPPDTSTILNTMSTTSVFDKYTGVQRIYSMSFQWYTGLGMLTVIIVGMLASLVTGMTDPKTLNPKLICPFFDIFFPCLPEKYRQKLRFGVRHYEVFQYYQYFDLFLCIGYRIGAACEDVNADSDNGDTYSDENEQMASVTNDEYVGRPVEKSHIDAEKGRTNEGFSPPSYDNTRL